MLTLNTAWTLDIMLRSSGLLASQDSTATDADIEDKRIGLLAELGLEYCRDFYFQCEDTEGKKRSNARTGKEAIPEPWNSG